MQAETATVGPVVPTLTPGAKLAAEAKPVLLPQLEVREQRPWLYAEVVGYRVLSLCTEKETRAVLGVLQAQVRGAMALLPPGARGTPPTPPLVVVTPRKDKPQSPPFFGPLFAFTSADSFVIFHERLGSSWAREDERRVAQTVASFATVHANWTLRSTCDGVWLEWYARQLGTMASWFDGASATRATFRRPAIFLPGLSVFVDGRSEMAPLIPLGEFFIAAQSPAAAKGWTNGKRALFGGEAQLFAYWAFWADKGAHREAFHRFASACVGEPVTEELYRKHFGLGFAETEALLVRAYRKMKDEETLTLSFREGAGAGKELALVRHASAAEIRLLLGEAYGLAADNRSNRAGRAEYRTKARALMEEAFRVGERDASAYAVMGFLAFRDGDYLEALKNFETAVEQRTDRARVYAYTSLLRLSAVRAGQAASRRLDAGQVAYILAPLVEVRTLFPEMDVIAQLVAETYARAELEVRPSREQLAALEIAARRQRDNPSFVRRVAGLHRVNGLVAVADTLDEIARMSRLPAARAEGAFEEMMDELDLFKSVSPGR